MDAKATKVLKCLNKMGGEQELFDISIAMKMDEEAVQKYLDALAKEGAANVREDGGKALWSAAAGGGKPSKATGKQKAATDDEFDLESVAATPPSPVPTPTAPPAPVPAPPQQAAPAPAAPIPQPVPMPPPPPPPAPAPVQKPAAPQVPPPPPAPAPKPAAPPPKPAVPAPAAVLDVDDFEPKPKKEKPVKAVKPEKVEDDDDDEVRTPRPTGKSLPPTLVAGIIGFVLLLILIFVTGGVGQGAVDKAVNDAKTEMDDKIKAAVGEANEKITKLEEEKKALETKVNELSEEISKMKARPASAPARGQRRR